MTDHVDQIHDVSTWRWSSLGLWVSTLWESWEKVRSRVCVDKLLMDPIEISSSDSDLEVEENGVYGREATNTRVLPHWGSASNGQTGFGGSNGSFSHHAPKANVLLHSIPDANRNLREDGFNNFPNGNSVQAPRINSRISNGSIGDYERLSSQQALKRTLPSTFHHPAPNKSVHVQENMVRHHASDAHGSYYQSSRPSSSNNKDYMREHNNGIRDDELVMLESRSSRVLPPSMMLGKAMATPQFASSSDALYRPTVDERLNITDERLIYQAALEDLNQPKVEASLPDGLLSVPLLRHQKIALAWMLQKETRSLHCLGGILADDQGLGKTVSMIALIQMQKSLESKSKLENSHNQKMEALNLDDDEETGTSCLNKDQETGDPNESKPVPEISTSSRAFSKRRPAAGTLVVCPASVLRQWARELDDKVADEAKLSVLIYHGGNRTKEAAELAKYDVVLTTYAIVTLEVPKQPLVDEDDADEKNDEKYGLSPEFSANKKRKKTFTAGKKGKKGKKGIDFETESGALARVGWFRVILDEAQTIKNHRTQVARACCSLRAKRRWCLSGTPIQNAIDDLYSYFRFLKYEPYAVYKSFYHTIKIPISRNSLHGYKKLQAVLRAIMLRRTKGTLIDGEPIITLPPKSINLAKVDFSLEERDFYTQLESASRTQFKAYAAAGTVRQNYASILLMLLLRQACDHPLLVKGYNSDSGKVSGEMAKKLPRHVLIDLVDILEASAVCQACNDTPEEPVITMCGHVFCYQCVSEYLTGDDNMCPEPKCKKQLNPDVVYTKATLRNCISDGVDDASTSSQPAGRPSIMQDDYSSSKIKAVLEILQTQCLAKPISPELQNDPNSFNDGSFHKYTFTEDCQSSANAVKHTRVYSNSPTDGPMKAIIFSQWTGMLNLVETSLNQFCIQYRRLDGTMSLAARDRAVKDFNTDPEITVMLMSLKAGNLGLNMVAACHVILLDLWWNPTTEDQAVDRAHRIGQTRPVTVTRITIKDTVEDRILSLQEEKRKMVASAFGEDQGGSSATRLTVEDLKYLFMI